MKSYIELTKKVIEKQIQSGVNERPRLIRIEDAPRPEIYWEVATYFSRWARNAGRDFVAKLSYGKYHHFLNRGDATAQAILERMKEAGFIDEDNHMTYWRNHAVEGDCFAILMGTEVVEDQGGLSDFFAITPEYMEQFLQGDYASWFEPLVGHLSDTEKTAINNVVESIFRVSSRNLFRLSSIVDRLERSRSAYDAEDLLTYLFDSLYDDWLLPRLCSNVPSTRELASAKKARTLFNELARFRNRQAFRDMSKSRISRLIQKIQDHPIQLDSPDQMPVYSTVDELKHDLILYVTGEDLPTVTPRILRCDYALIKSILELKSSRRRPGTDPGPAKVYGPPIKAFLSIIFDILGDNPDVTSIDFNVSQARLAGCATDVDVYEQWDKVRLVAGGLLDFLNAEFAETCELRVGWANNRVPFSHPKVEGRTDETVVRRAPASKKLSSIEISVETSSCEQRDFVWEFNPKAPWIYTFFHVRNGLNDGRLNRHGSRYLPVLGVERFSELITSNNDEEFFARLETSIVDNSKNVVSYMSSKLPVASHGEMLSKLEELGERFTHFLDALNEHGFYAAPTQKRIAAFIEYYCNSIAWLGSISLTSAARDALPALANAFLLTDADHELTAKGLSGAIVLPVHPAMLEKLVAQAQFIRDGAAEIIHTLRTEQGSVREAEQRLKTFEQLSTISLSVDTLWADKAGGFLPPTHTFGPFTIYRDEDMRAAHVSLNSVVADDVAADEEIPASEVLRESPISDVIYGKLSSYLKTLPSQADGMHIVFVNPPDLQPVVAGIHRLIDSLKSRANGSTVRVRLTVLASPQSLGSRSYLHYWLDNFFEETDQVHITTYFKTIPFSSDKLGGRIRIALRDVPTADVTFLQNVMAVREIQFEDTSSIEADTYLTRFPMVFHPLPVFLTSTHRRTGISQLQFRASSAHTRLIQYLTRRMNPYIDCAVINELQLQPDYDELLKTVHEHSRWVVCIDPGIDRDIISTSEQGIISFATGEGPFGELNVTVSTKRDTRADLAVKLKRRLRQLLNQWSDDVLDSAVTECFHSVERLDGAHLLQALNPDDHQLHSFLAYILTARYLKADSSDDPEVLIRTLVPLDSYDHWFRPNVDRTTRGSAKRPDFLLLEVKRGVPGEKLSINATVIECKMGRQLDVHVEEGRIQLAHGLRVLRSIWNPERESIDKRYWYSQLYRALVFSKVNMTEDDPLYHEFNNQLQEILAGNFAISWRGLLLTYWLDTPSDTVETLNLPLDGASEIHAEQHAFGQNAVQDLLVNRESKLHYMSRAESDVSRYALESSTHEHEADEHVPEPDTKESPRENSHTTLGTNSESEARTASVDLPLAPNVSSEGEGSPSSGTDYMADSASSTTEKERANSLQEVRLLIGQDVRTGEPIYWEYGHPQLQNRHILITGSSGTGKTYFMQALLLELSEHGVSSLIFDYTDGFTPQKLESEFVALVGDKIVQLPIYHDPFPLNPFKRYPIEVAGEVTLQKPVDVAERIKSSFTKVFDLGDQQANAVYNAVKNGMAKYGEGMTLENLGDELRLLGERLSNARTALARIEPLIDRDPFDHSSSQDWSILQRNPGTIMVVQLSGFTRDVQVAITQLILWDAWYYQVKHGDKNRPFPVILDEAQNMDHSETSPTAMILTEGRKFGWSGWFATQFLKGQMDQDELGRLQQASQKVFFKPPEAELREVALMIDPDRSQMADWQVRLARLQKGQCVVSGWVQQGAKLLKDKPRIVQITPLSARGGARS